jgi:sugar phosphate isomerase/epimerase
MSTTGITFSVFTKPWRDLTIPELGKWVSGLGFDGVELPVRPGFQVEPDDVTEGLPRAVEQLATSGVQVTSVAGPTDEATIAACADVGVPTIRVMASIGDDGYMTTEARLQRRYKALMPLLQKYGVRVGVQNHCGRDVCDAMGLRHLIEDFDPAYIGAVWDAGHNGLQGEEPELALDIVWSHLCMVNLKNAFWRRTNGPEAEYAEWRPYWTSGRHGLASWPRVAAELKQREYRGVVCLTAEYSDHSAVDRLIAEDIAFAKSLFA